MRRYKNDVNQIKHKHRSEIMLDIQRFLNHINFIKLGYYDSLLMNTP